MGNNVINVLLVEDESAHAKLIKKHLENSDSKKFLVSIAKNIDKAVEIIESSPPDVVVCDFRLPDGEGLDIVKKYGSHSENPLPIIITTSHGNEQLAVQTMKSGAMDYIAKSMDSFSLMPHIVMRTLREWQRDKDKKTTEIKLDESEQKYKTVFENTGNASAIIDENGVLLEVNQEFVKYSGYTKPEIEKEMHWREFVFSENDLILNQLESLANGKEITNIQNYEGRFLSKNGDVKHVIVTMDSIPSSSNFIISLLDITEKIEAANEMVKLEAQLQQSQKMEAIGRLAGGVAHDFNNLLTGIAGNASLAIMDTKADNPLMEYLQEIQKISDRAAKLTRQLLAFSRRQIIEPKIINLNESIKDLNNMLARIIGEDVKLELKLGDNLNNIKVDPGQMEQIIVNLVVNARDAMPEGGYLTIETRNMNLSGKQCQDYMDVSPGPYVCMNIKDTGIGMNKDIVDKIFEPFYTTKPNDKGTGLGLSTVYGIVKQHMGFIEVSSKEGKGSEFKVSFPIMNEQSWGKSETVIVDELPKGNETILLVEDEALVRNMTYKILRRLGYDVLQANNGDDGEYIYNEHAGKIDLLMTDIVMPGMGGAQLAKKLKDIDPKIKIMFTSGYTSDEIIKHGIRDGDVDFIGKPYSPDRLAQKIREVLDRQL